MFFVEKNVIVNKISAELLFRNKETISTDFRASVVHTFSYTQRASSYVGYTLHASSYVGATCRTLRSGRSRP